MQALSTNRMDIMPTSHGCYYKQPTSGNGKCGDPPPNEWTLDSWGKDHTGSFANEERCLKRKAGHDSTCGTTSTWTYVAPPLPTSPGCYYLSTKGNGECGEATEGVWTVDTWGTENVDSFKDEETCMKRKAGHDSYCGTTSTWAYVGPKVSGSGDPHMVNILGEQFNLWRLGEVELLKIPRHAAKPLLHMVVNVSDAGHYTNNDCVEAPYMTAMNLSLHGDELGISMVDDKMKVFLNGVPLAPSFTPVKLGKRWREFDGFSVVVPSDYHVKVDVGKASIDVIQPRHPQHFFLNMAASGLESLGLEVGGVLGKDSHTEVSVKPAHCGQLIEKSRLDRSTAIGGFRLTASLA